MELLGTSQRAASAPPAQTTTMSLIGVRSGSDTTIIIAMLKSLGYVELRIDEMRPRLLDIGANAAEARYRLEAHRNLLERLKSKQDQVDQLLAGADKLVTEQKTEDGIVVYEAMADSLGTAWRELNRQLELRGYILEDTLRFYVEAEKQAQTTSHLNDLLQAFASGHATQQLIAEASGARNHLLDVTVNAVELGSSVINQIRVLGALADNAERPAETADACLLIERVMLGLASNWESLDEVWSEQKARFGPLTNGVGPSEHAHLGDQLTAIENWLRGIQADVAHGNLSPDSVSSLLQLAKAQKSEVKRLGAEIESQGAPQDLLARAKDLKRSIDGLIKVLQERSQLSSKITQFVYNADLALSQLDKMEIDLAEASAAIAGELGPLARQKALTVIDEGDALLRIVPNEPTVTDRLTKLQNRLAYIESLASERIEYGTAQLKSQIGALTSWIRDVGEPFLASHGNLGSDGVTTKTFIDEHSEFASTVYNKEHEANSVLNRTHELGAEDRRQLDDFEERYETLKQILESRINLGKNFLQVQHLGSNIDQSFTHLESLLDPKRGPMLGNVNDQMSNLLHMLHSTLQQESQHADKFEASAKVLASHDVHLNADRAIEVVRRIVTVHKQRVSEITRQWQTLQEASVAASQTSATATRVIEEVQMWQVDTFEVVRTLEDAVSSAQDVQEKEHIRETVEEVIKQLPAQKQRITEVKNLLNEEQTQDSVRRISEAVESQKQIEDRLHSVLNKVTTSELFFEEGSRQLEQTQPPPIPQSTQSRITTSEFFTDDMQIQLEQTQRPQQPQQTVTTSQSYIEEGNYQLEQAQRPQIPQHKVTTSQIYVEEGNRQLEHAQRQQQPQQTVTRSQIYVEEGSRQLEHAQPPPPPQPTQNRVTTSTSEFFTETGSQQLEQVQRPQIPQHNITTSQIFVEEGSRQLEHAQRQEPPQQTVTTSHIYVEEGNRQLEHAQRQQPPQQTVTRSQIYVEEGSRQLEHAQPPPPPQPTQNRVTTSTSEFFTETGSQQLEQSQRPQPPPHKVTTSEIFVEAGTNQLEHTQRPQPPQTPPKLITELRDAQVDEGSRFEFSARVEAAPEPRITWAKDGIDVKSNVDYRQTYINGVATLTIEETFIEDTAVYTVRVENPLGSAESSAQLTVKSKSQLGFPVESQKPRFIKSLQNVTVIEGETAILDCVVQAQPEPKVTWYKEEELIVESEKVILDFRGDHVSLAIRNVTPADSGVYKAVARNEYGESSQFSRISVLTATPTRKVPPRTPPKPPTPVHEPPAFKPSLHNKIVEEGQQTVFEVRTIGTPPPRVSWKFKEVPVQQASLPSTRVVEEEGGWSKLIIDAARPQHTGLYTVEAINESGSARSGATLIVNAPSAPAPAQTTHQTHTVTTIQQEGFWSDGGYTGGTPTPPPVPLHRTTTTLEETFLEKDVGDVGYSSIANAPEVVRPFVKEYTVNESEKTQIDCLLVGNPRPKVKWFFNDQSAARIQASSGVEFKNVGDTYSIIFSPAKLEHAGFYRMVAENVKGSAETSTVIHVRPRSLIPQPTQKAARKPHTIEHQRIVETFGAVDYNEIVGQKHQRATGPTPPPAKRAHSSGAQEHQINVSTAGSQNYHSQTLSGAQREISPSKGTPPHFVQTLVSSVTTIGEATKFEGVVTGLPPPEITWTKDGVTITRESHPHIEFSNIGGRILLAFRQTGLSDSGKYMCSARNVSGVATSSAQLVVRPKTVAPDFVKRLISEELVEGGRLHWTVKVTGDPLPKVTWLRDGHIVPNCEEVQLVEEGPGVHTMIIPKIVLADAGQFTCLAENSAGEARSTADLVVRPEGTEPGTFFHITKVTQERQVKGEEVSRNQTFSIENPRTTPTPTLLQ